MAIPRLLKLLHRSGWEFWLPLPLVAIAFWNMGNTMTHHVLTRSHTSVSPLQADTLQPDMQPGLNLPDTVLAINAEIDLQRGITTVWVRTDDTRMSETTYEIAVTELERIETAIAHQLNLPVDGVRSLASYRLKN